MLFRCIGLSKIFLSDNDGSVDSMKGSHVSIDEIDELKRLVRESRKYKLRTTYILHLPSNKSVPGLLKQLQNNYYPNFNLPFAPLCGKLSSLAGGQMSDLFCSHALGCAQVRNGIFCQCLKWDTSYQIELKNVKYYFDDIKKLDLIHLASQFPIGTQKCATLIDDLFWDGKKKELVLIERKNGYARLIDVPAGQNTGGKFLKNPFQKFTNCVFHHHMLQINFAVALVKKFTRVPVKGYIVYMTPEFKHRNAISNLKLSWHHNYMNKIDLNNSIL